MYLQKIMSSYLNESKHEFVIDNNFKPLTVSKKSWSFEDKRATKSFTFDSNRFLEAFVVQILKYIRESESIIEFRVKEDKVGCIVHALSPSISEIEIEATEDIDKIKKDVMYYYAK